MSKRTSGKRKTFPKVDIIRGSSINSNSCRVSVPKTSPTGLYRRTVHENGNILIEPVKVLTIEESEGMDLPDSVGTKGD